MRRLLTLVALIVAAACGSDVTPTGVVTTNPPPAPPPPPPPSVPVGQIADTVIGVGGGTVTYTKAGDVMSGFQMVIPAGALDRSLNITVSYGSSAGIPLGSELTTTEPVLMLDSDGPFVTSEDFTLRIPMSLPGGVDPVVVVVDSARGVLGVLTAVDEDASSVTVSSRALDQSVVHGPTGGPVLGRVVPWTPKAGTPSLLFRSRLLQPMPSHIRLVVTHLAGSTSAAALGQLLATDLSWGFAAGKHDWEFNPHNTALGGGTSTAIGQVLSEWWIFTVGDLATGGQLWGVGQQAAGVDGSNPDGIMLSAGLTSDFQGLIGATIRNQVAYAKARPTVYHRNVAIATYQMMQLVQSVQPLILATSSGTYKLVLVTGWSAGGRYFTAVDPAAPGIVQHLDFSSGVMAPYAEPGNPSLIWDVPIFANQLLWATIFLRMGPQFKDLGASSTVSPYAAVWPAWIWQTWDGLVEPAIKGAPDTLFMVRDTSRLWIAGEAPFGMSTVLPVPPGARLEAVAPYYKAVDGSWVLDLVSADGSYPIDAAHFGKSAGAPWVDGEIGIIAEAYAKADLSVVQWLGWRTIALIEFGFAIHPVPASPGSPVTMSIVSLGGPPLPADAKYEWNFNDGTPLVTVAGSLNVTHTFQNSGIFTVGVNVLHGKTGEVIGHTTSSATVGAHFSVIFNPALAAVGAPALHLTARNLAPTSTLYEYVWNFGDNTSPVTVDDDSTITYSYQSAGTYTAQVSVVDKSTHLTITTASAPVAVAPAQVAWRFDTFVLAGSTPFINPTGNPGSAAGVAKQDAFLAQVVATPNDGLLFLADGVTFSEPGVYFEVVAPGTGINTYYWQPGAFITQVSRTLNAACCGDSYSNTGNDRFDRAASAGALTGDAGVSLFNPLTTFINHIAASKNSNHTMQGTITFTAGIFSAQRVYSFTATQVR